MELITSQVHACVDKYIQCALVATADELIEQLDVLYMLILF